MEVFLIGIGVWFATGIDDFFAVLLLFQQAKDRGEDAWEVLAGTLGGVLVMLGAVLVLATGVNQFNLGEFVRLGGFVPFMMGYFTLVSLFNIKENDDEEVDIGTKRINKIKDLPIFLKAMGIYLGQSFDDMSVLTSLLIASKTISIGTLGAGVCVGCIVSVVLAHWLASLTRKYETYVKVLASCVLITIGVMVLLGFI